MKRTIINKRNRLASLLLLLVLVVAGGCGDTGPAAAAEDFIKAALDEDCAAMLELSSSESIGSQSREEAIRECEESGELSQIFGLLDDIELKGFETIEEDISVSGEEATVRARMTMKSGGQEESLEQTFLLVNEEGEWKVDL
ncbi:MAG: nuclear transport factor 2 family protein [Thermoleophilia bacterium]